MSPSLKATLGVLAFVGLLAGWVFSLFVAPIVSVAIGCIAFLYCLCELWLALRDSCAPVDRK